MRLDQRVQRGQGRRAGADMIGQRREAEVDAFARVALALPVQRLVLTELLEQDHRQQARAGQPSRDRVERRRRLRDRLARPAGEALAHRLDHLPLPRDDLQRLGDVLAELRQLVEPQHGQAQGAATTTRSRGRCAGNGLRAGRRRSKGATWLDDGARSATSSSSVAAAYGVLQLQFQLPEQTLLASERTPYSARFSFSISRLRWATSARPSKPLRMSVCPVANQTRHP